MNKKTLKKAIKLNNNLEQCKHLEPSIMFKTINSLGIHKNEHPMNHAYSCNLGNSDIGKRLIKAAQHALQMEFTSIQEEFEHELKHL